MNKKIKLEEFDTLQITLPDGTQLIIYDDRGDIDIKTAYCGMMILPIASNHISIKKDDIKIPKSSK
jgi:hypothetical protein